MIYFLMWHHFIVLCPLHHVRLLCYMTTQKQWILNISVEIDRKKLFLFLCVFFFNRWLLIVMYNICIIIMYIKVLFGSLWNSINWKKLNDKRSRFGHVTFYTLIVYRYMLLTWTATFHIMLFCFKLFSLFLCLVPKLHF